MPPVLHAIVLFCSLYIVVGLKGLPFRPVSIAKRPHDRTTAKPPATFLSNANTADVSVSYLPKEAVIVGSGPIGLAAAIMLARKGVAKVQVFDQLSKPVHPNNASYWGTFQSERSYNIGLSGRAQKALKELDALDRVLQYVCPLQAAAFW
eukprot:gene5426-6756_t